MTNPEDHVVDEISKLVDWQLEQGERGEQQYWGSMLSQDFSELIQRFRDA